MALAGCDISGSCEVCNQMYDNSFSGVLLHISYADLHHPHLHVELVKFHFLILELAEQLHGPAPHVALMQRRRL